MGQCPADQPESGVVGEDVGARGGEFGRVQVGEVEDMGLDGAREVPGRPGQAGEWVEAFGVPGDGPHLGSGGGEPQRAGTADTSGGAGDEGRTAV
ncbi:hypothetical protein GCM10023083_21920 [Streptomyces phyllanthi]